MIHWFFCVCLFSKACIPRKEVFDQISRSSTILNQIYSLETCLHEKWTWILLCMVKFWTLRSVSPLGVLEPKVVGNNPLWISSTAWSTADDAAITFSCRWCRKYLERWWCWCCAADRVQVGRRGQSSKWRPCRRKSSRWNPAACRNWRSRWCYRRWQVQERRLRQWGWSPIPAQQHARKQWTNTSWLSFSHLQWSYGARERESSVALELPPVVVPSYDSSSLRDNGPQRTRKTRQQYVSQRRCCVWQRKDVYILKMFEISSRLTW